MKNIASIFLLLLALSGALFFSAFSSAASIGGVGGKPAHITEKNESEQWFKYTLKPGESVEDELLVENNTDQTVNIKLYPADWTPSTDGGFALEQEVESRDELGAWVTLSQTELVLGAGESSIVPFTLTVPNDVSLDVGEHAGGILIQPVTEGSEQGGLVLQLRTGVRIYVTIPGEIVESLKMSEFSVDANKDMLDATVSIKNDGNVSENIKLVLTADLAWEWLNKIYPNYSVTVERDLQVLRDSELRSNFEIPKPFLAPLRLSANIVYNDEENALSESVLDVWAYPNKESRQILAVGAFFVFTLFLYLFLRRRR